MTIPVIISGGDPLAVTLAASLGMAGFTVDWFLSSRLPRQRGGVPGLLLPRHSPQHGVITQRWTTWLAQFELTPADIAFHELDLTTDPTTPIATIDVYRLWQRFELIAIQQGVRTKRYAAVPYWDNAKVIGVQYGRQYQQATQVVLTTGMSLSQFWRFATPATILDDHAQRHGDGHRARYLFPFDGHVYLSGDELPTAEVLPETIEPSVGPTAIQGIGLPSGPIRTAITIPAPGLMSVWGAAGYGLYALPQLVTHIQQVLQTTQPATLDATNASDVDDVELL